MSLENNLDRIRENTMGRLERSRRWFVGLIVAAGVVETAGVVALLVLCDYSNRTHLLIVIAAFLVYWVLALWTWALAAHSSMNAQRILKAIALWHDDASHS